MTNLHIITSYIPPPPGMPLGMVSAIWENGQAAQSYTRYGFMVYETIEATCEQIPAAVLIAMDNTVMEYTNER